ncbi:MAG: alpha-amylase [Marinilabiliales bacterium]|nr:MAG: alpha-amylase [Marinilabiliales bacterium]
MRTICFYFQVHQPYRLRNYRFFDIADKHDYFDDYNNSFIMRKIAEKSYLPMNKLLLELIKEYGSAFKVSFSISGTAIDQFEEYAPEVLESFKRLADTGNVEFLAETYAHSLSALRSKDEFLRQVKMHTKKIEQHFGQKPTTFRNTELVYSDKIGEMVAEMGYKVMLTEGAKHVLGWRSPNYMYANAIRPELKLLLKNFRLSDDIAFRFSEQSWSDFPLTTEKFVDWLDKTDKKEETINLFMDYETFGEHQWAETGIFDFMKSLPKRVFSHTNFSFATPAELGAKLQAVSPINVPNEISWADEERDITAWLGIDLQEEAFDKLYELEKKVKHCQDPQIQKDWLYLQTSDHFYYMCTKWFSDGDVHKYFNPYSSPYDAFINYMNVLSDFIIRVEENSTYGKDGFEGVKETAGDLFDKTVEVTRETLKRAGRKVKSTTDKAADIKFDDIKDMSNTAVKKLIKEVDIDELAVALKGAEKKLTEKVIPNLSAKAKKKYDEIQSEIKKINKKDIKSYREKIEDKLSEIFKK